MTSIGAFFLALAAGFGVAAVFYAGIGGQPPATALALLVFGVYFLIGLSFGLVNSAGIRLAGLAASAGPLLYATGSIFLDIRRDPTSHNLLPFELLFALLLAFPWVAFGVLCGYAATRFARLPSKAPLVPACTAALLLALGPVFSAGVQKSGAVSAVQMLRKLWQAERDYAAKDARHRYTCDGPLLPGFERARWFGQASLGLTAKDYLIDSQYFYTLHCGPLSRGDGLEIVASPKTRGGTLYCIDQRGVINQAPADNLHNCGP